jgi:class 3 adenylate cyclase
MPIFVDRHELPAGTTALEVARAHVEDLALQDRFGVEFLAYWFDADRGTLFCLVRAPDQEAVNRVHREAHGGTANAVIEVELSAVEAFLGRIADPPPGPALGRPAAGPGPPAFRPGMFTDIAGATEMTARLGDRRAVEVVRAHDGLVRRALAAHGGREVKHTGDGIMASFGDAAAAVGCARAIVEAFAGFNRSSREPIRVRVGLHAGEPVEDGEDLFGSAVQLASRICRAAEPGTAVASGEVRAACGDAGAGAGSGWVALGETRLRGFPAPVPLFRVAGAPEPASFADECGIVR